MRAGIRGLGLTPTEFWALTPAELTLMLGASDEEQTINRTRLEELAHAFPDNPKSGG